MFLYDSDLLRVDNSDDMGVCIGLDVGFSERQGRNKPINNVQYKAKNEIRARRY